MKTFYLYIDDGIFIQRDILCLIQELFEIQFAVVFDLLKFCKNLLVVFVFKQFFQLVGRQLQRQLREILTEKRA